MNLTGELTKNIRATIKMILFVITVVFYLLTALLFYPLSFIDAFLARRFLIRVISFYSSIALAFMGVSVRVKGSVPTIQGKFIVCNHMGYLDVLVIASKIRACFVTSLEMRKTPFLGQLCEMGGCLYVDRKSRANLSQEVGMLTSALKRGLNVCVFPEGTSTDGSAVLRFKRPLFNAAIDANVSVQTMCLNYEEVNAESVNSQNRDSIFWYADMTFLPHLWSFFKNSQVEVELSMGEEIMDEFDYTKLSVLAHDRVDKLFRPIPGTYSSCESRAHCGSEASGIASS